MLKIFGMSCPFQIRDMAIKFVPVNVIHFGLAVGIGNKIFGNEAVNFKRLAFSVFVEFNINVISSKKRFHNPQSAVL